MSGMVWPWAAASCSLVGPLGMGAIALADDLIMTGYLVGYLVGYLFGGAWVGLFLQQTGIYDEGVFMTILFGPRAAQ